MYPLLNGLRIIEISAFVAVPFCGNTLAQLGAQVIRIDPPGGGVDSRRWPLSDEGGSIYWSGLNHAKQHVEADLRDPQVQERVIDLLGDDGIVITNLSPGFLMDGRLLQKKPRTIIATLEGFPDGRSAVDYTVGAASGLPLIAGPEGHEGPINSPFPCWDMIAGLQLALALVAAERRRRLEGCGAWIRCSLSDVMLSAMTTLGFVGETEATKESRQRLGNHIYGTFGHDFSTGDGERLMLVALTPRQWSELCRVTGTGGAFTQIENEKGLDLRKEADRFAAREEIRTVLAAWFAERTLAQVQELFAPTSICWHPYLTIGELARPGGPIESSAVFERVSHHGVGEIWTAGPVFRLEGEARAPLRPTPPAAQKSSIADLAGAGHDDRSER